MMDRPRLTGWDWLLLACAAVAPGCGGSLPPAAPQGTACTVTSAPQDLRAVQEEPRRLAESIVPASFRSRRAAQRTAQRTAQLPDAPEVSIGTPDDAAGMPDEAAEDQPGDASTSTERLTAVPDEAPAFAVPPDPYEQFTPELSSGGGPAGQESLGQQRLPWARTAPRSAEMEAMAQRSDALVRQGFRLAERGAMYSARANFVEALGLISRSLDLEQQTQVYSQALSNGRTALAEARDFAAHGAAAPVDIVRIVAGHRTPVLKAENLRQYSPVTAQQRYYTYAQEQLALAAGDEPAGSMALYALGKSAPQVRRSSASGPFAALGEQVACFQAALMADGKNFRAANELGVILAENGRLESARDLLSSSLAASQQPAAWRNLAAVLARLGDTAGAGDALRHAEALQSTAATGVTGDNLRWVDPATFARTLPPSEGLIPPPTTARPPEPPATPAAPKKRTALQLPWTGGWRR
jgi:hypothetical protein